jgi:two-component system, OmpR family, sensor histidine kinase SenX3
VSALGLLAAVLAGAVVAGVAVAVTARRAQQAERHRSSRELQTAHAAAGAAAVRLEAILDGLPVALLVFRPDGNLRHANGAGRRYGHARPGDALVSAAIRDLVTMARQATAQPFPLGRRLELVGPPARTVDLAVAPLGDGSGDVLAVVEDITERRRLEEMRRDFVANISHELRTPVGALSLLAETLEGEDDPQIVARLAGRLHREALRLGRTVDDLLLLSRIEVGGLATEALSAGEIVAEAIDRTAVNARERQIEVKVDGDGSLACRLVGNRVQLVSALANLIDNAVTYSDPGSVVLLSAAEAGGHLELGVVDHGIGIPAQDIERIFERFYRVDRARSRRTGGTGLGLAIVRHVATNHGGEVRVTSREGEGSTFVLRLPLALPG